MATRREKQGEHVFLYCIKAMLNSIVNITDCEIPPKKMRLLKGRSRFATSIVTELAELSHSTGSKQILFEKAVDNAIGASSTTKSRMMIVLLFTYSAKWLSSLS